MGWWNLTAWKKDAQGNEVDLSDCDLENIAQQIREGYIQGEIVNED